MTAIEIVERRTEMGTADATFYVGLAEARVRSYLHLESDADVSAYTAQVVDIAVLLWQKDQSTKNTSSSLGYSRETFTEGGVSHSVASMNGSLILATYENAIVDVLNTLDGINGQVVFL